MEELKNQIEQTNIPNHVAVIMDGNGRWAKKQGIKRILGHQNGIKAVKNITECSTEIGINYLTLYVFSTENWGRPKYEVDSLMNLLVNTIKNELPSLKKNKIKLSIIGEVSGLPKTAQQKLKNAIDSTAENKQMELILALNYSGKWDLLQSINRLYEEKKYPIKESDIKKYLSTSKIPDPDLLIRTSGEMRISNFFLWQMAYTELYFTDVLWPDFSKKNLYEAIISYQKRERRYGKISDKINI